MLLLRRRYTHLSHHLSPPPLTLASPQKQQKPKPKPKPSHSIISQLINKNPNWSPHLESTLSLLCSNLSKTHLLKTLPLIKSPSKALNFFNFLHKSFHHDDQTYLSMLQILARTHNLNAARNFLFSIIGKISSNVSDRFFNTLIRSYGKAGLLRESVRVFNKMKEIGVPRSVFSFNSLLSVLLRRGRTVMAKKLYDEMVSVDRILPDVYTFNTLIRGFCLNSMVDEGFMFFKEMSRSGCDPDIVTYNTLVDGLCRAGKVRIAHNLLNGMRSKSSELNPNVITYTTLIRGYCEKQSVEEALEMFDEMLSRGLKPNG
ncbi:pentatricopeptide repeat-containing protein At1g02060, chloroplastic-like [Tasmannia lanceolata]|uniref:pentatricopeptide repeat-containing protein At1g02060, chloroplastic-like n=1 Tax=Tasmannia lanceolata TaxID=3420 RepID=UPI004062A0D0